MANFSVERVDPDALRFTQDSIAAYVRYEGEEVRLDRNLKLLRSGQLHPDDFPPLEVYRDEDGVVWSNDNRRLWLFRKAGISQIKVKVYTEPLRRAPPEMKEDRDNMSKPDYFPRVRRKRQAADVVASRISQASPFRGELRAPQSVHTRGPNTTKSPDLMNMASRMINVDPNASRIYQASPSRGESRAPQSVHTHGPNTTKSADLMNTAPRMVKVDPNASRIYQASPSQGELRAPQSIHTCGTNTTESEFRMVKVNANETRFTQTIRGHSPEKRSPPTSNRNHDREVESTDNSYSLVLGTAATASALLMGCSAPTSLLVGVASWMFFKISGK